MKLAANLPAVVITGVSSGIGLATAQDLLAKGYQVFGSVRRAEDVALLVAEWGDVFVPLIFDVADSVDLQRAVEIVRLELKGRVLSGLVNNAGVSFAGPLIIQPLEEVRLTFEVNVFGLLAVTRAFLPLLQVGPGSAEQPGRVINISSVSGGVTVPFLAAYSGAKHAVEAFTQGLRRELGIFGIHVSAIEPGFIRSRLFEKAQASKPEERYLNTPYAAPWLRFNEALRTLEEKAKPAVTVTRAVHHALQSPRPKTRYPLDSLWHIGRFVSDRFFDHLIFKALGISALMRRS